MVDLLQGERKPAPRIANHGQMSHLLSRNLGIFGWTDPR